MQLAALSCVLRQTNLREHLVWKLPEPHILHTKPPASWDRYEGVKEGTTKPQWPRVASKDRSRSGAWKLKHLVQRQWRVEGAELKNCMKIPSSFYSLPFPELLHHIMWLILVDLAGFICSVVLLSAGSWPVLPVVVFFLEEHGQSRVKRWCLNSGCPCLLTWDKTQRKVRFSRHWSVDRQFEALRGAPKMLQPTTGVAGCISTISFICLVLGLPAVHTSATAPVWFLFSTFFFCFWLGCLLFGIFWKLSLEYLHFAQWHTAGNSSGTALGNAGSARGPYRFSDVVLPAPHLWVSGEPYPWELCEWKNKEDVMVSRDTSNGHMHVCPSVVGLLVGWESNSLGGALLSFFFLKWLICSCKMSWCRTRKPLDA